MRFLKKKVCLLMDEAGEKDSDFEDPQQRTLTIKQEDLSVYNSDIISKASGETKGLMSRRTKSESVASLREPKRRKTPANSDSKNIVKNYGKALCGFASSKLALTYIEAAVKKEGYDGFNIHKFMQHMKEKKTIVNSMDHIRSLLVEEDGDSNEQKMYKRIFKQVSIIFMKFFSVNWIFSGKLFHKTVHLKFRGKMLRRIQNPEQFTYLKTIIRN